MATAPIVKAAVLTCSAMPPQPLPPLHSRPTSRLAMMQTAVPFAQLQTSQSLQTAIFNPMLRSLRVGLVSSTRRESQRLSSARLWTTAPLARLTKALRALLERKAIAPMDLLFACHALQGGSRRKAECRAARRAAAAREATALAYFASHAPQKRTRRAARRYAPAADHAVWTALEEC